MRGSFVAIALAAWTSFLASAPAHAQDRDVPDPVFADNWSASDSNGAINASVVFNGHLYLGGAFTSIGGIDANGIAEFDGRQYHALTTGIGGSSFGTLAVKALLPFNNKLIVAGSFTTAGGVTCNSIAAWDSVTRTWTTLGAGLGQSGGSPADVHCLAVSSVTGSPQLYAGGFFNLCGGATACLNIAGWDGSVWNNAGGGVNATINALADLNGTLYSGGSGSSSSRLRWWMGAAPWAQVPGGTISGNGNRVNTLLSANGKLWIGGSFTNGGGITTSENIVSFNGSTFGPLGAGLPDAALGVTCLAAHNDGTSSTVVAGGGFTGRVQYINDSGGPAWTIEGDGLTNSPNTLTSFSSGSEHDLFAGTSSALLVYTPGQAWTNPGDGTNGSFSVINAMTAGTGPSLSAFQILDTLYITGVFNAYANVFYQQPFVTARESAARSRCTTNLKALALASHQYIATPLGAGFNNAGYRCSYWSDPNSRYVAFCGSQTSAGGQLSSGLSFYFPASGTWSSPTLPAHTGSILDYSVQSDRATQRIFVMGDFANTGTPGLDFFGSLTPSGLTPITCGPNATVRRMRRLQSLGAPCARIGDFTSTGCPAQATGYIDLFNPATGQSQPWSGQLFDAPVLDACEAPPFPSAQPGFYVGGRFIMAGATVVNHVAYWNGSQWLALGTGLNGDVAAMTIWDDGTGANLYVVGAFTSAGGQPANRIARWNGSQWSAVGGGTENGLNAQASSLQVVDYGDDHGPSLMIGGSFTRAGGLSSGRIAQLVSRGAPVIAVQPPPVTTFNPGATVNLSLRAYRSPPLSYRWRKGLVNLSDGPAPGGSLISGSATATLTITGAGAGDVGNYDCVVTNSYSSTTSDTASVTSCAADFNNDGSVDFFDYDEFVVCFEGGPCPPGRTADFDGDGSADFFD